MKVDTIFQEFLCFGEITEDSDENWIPMHKSWNRLHSQFHL